MFDLLHPILVIVVGFLVKKALAALDVQLSDEVFNSIVAGIVVWLLALVGIQQAASLF